MSTPPHKRPRRKRDTAARVFSRPQRAVLALVAVCAGYQAYHYGWHATVVTVLALCEVFYLVFVGSKILLGVASYSTPIQRKGKLPDPTDHRLPIFTILLPVLREKPHTLRQLLRAMADLEYPWFRLQILPLIEYHDKSSLALFGLDGGDPTVTERLELPRNVTPIVTVPGAPGTKASACALGVAQAIGTYTVIFDAEDVTDPQILLKALRDFEAAPSDVACLQAPLVFWNIDPRVRGSRRAWLHSLVTSMYFVEYVVHFRFILRGMARLRLAPPLGGTSNIFVTDVLREIAIPTEQLVRDGIARQVAVQMVASWDPFNVAEDADVGGWLGRYGYHVRLIDDSYTLEEACQEPLAALRQRQRWGKGYAQSGLVQTRHPIRAMREMGAVSYAFYILLTLGTPLSLMINPVFWGLTIAYFVTHSAFIQSLFPAPIFYMGALTGIVGNFVLFYLQIVACLREREPGLVKYMLLQIPWWVFTSVSMWMGVLELFVPGLRSVWHLTAHGNVDPQIAREVIAARHDLMSARS